MHIDATMIQGEEGKGKITKFLFLHTRFLRRKQQEQLSERHAAATTTGRRR
jgi:hypothetical protein